MASHSTTMATPIINRASFEDMLAEEANYTPDHQPRHVRFMDTLKGGLTSTSCTQPEDVPLPSRPVSDSYPEEIGLHVATREFKKMGEPKFSKLKGGYTSSAGFVFQSWMKDIHVHIQYRGLTQREAIQLVNDFTMGCAWDEVEFYMGMVMEEDQSFKGLIEHLRDAFQSGKTLSKLISDFNGRSQKAIETEDTFADDLQVLVKKIIAQKPSFHLEANQQLKGQYMHKLWDPY